jgi:hypothetical protein
MQRVDVWSFEFSGWRNCWWAFVSMGKSELSVADVPGLSFAKQLGTGSGAGFSVWPNFGRYVWVLVWSGADAVACADRFYADNPVFQAHRERSQSAHWWRMTGLRSHGTWNGLQPFECLPDAATTGRVAVITRASIKRSQFWRFWSRVSSSAKLLKDRPGLECAVGIGELPLVEQATFSVWSNAEALEGFAYRSPNHAKRIRETYRYGWYSEEQFTRFAVLSDGLDSLPN